jgi:hypothetical protein
MASSSILIVSKRKQATICIMNVHICAHKDATRTVITTLQAATQRYVLPTADMCEI